MRECVHSSLWWHDAENFILAEEVVLLLAHFNRFAAEFGKKHRVAALDVCERENKRRSERRVSRTLLFFINKKKKERISPWVFVCVLSRAIRTI